MFCSAVSLISSLNKHSFFQSIIGKEFCFGAPSERCQFEQRRSLLKLSARSSSGTNGLFFQAPQVALSNKYPGSMNYSQTQSHHSTVVGLHSLQRSSGKVIALCTSTVLSTRGNTVPVHSVSPRNMSTLGSSLLLYFMLNGLRSKVQNPNLPLSWLKVL